MLVSNNNTLGSQNINSFLTETRPNVMSALVLISALLRFSHRNIGPKDLLVGHVIHSSPSLVLFSTLHFSLSAFLFYIPLIQARGCVRDLFSPTER